MGYQITEIGMPLDLTDDDRAILAELLRERIQRDAFPLSPRFTICTSGT